MNIIKRQTNQTRTQQFLIFIKHLWLRYQRLGIVAIVIILIRELLWERILDFANAQIDSFINSLPKIISPLVDWLIKDAFHFTSGLAILVLVFILIRVYLDTKSQIPLSGIKVEAYPRHQEAYASLKVFNESNEPLRCYAYLTKLVLVYTPDTRIDIRDSVNPGQARLSWHSGSDDGVKQIDPRTLPGVLNIAKQFGNEIVFTFQDGNRKYHGHHFEIEVEIVADADGGSLHLTTWIGCIDQAPSIQIRECVHGVNEEAFERETAG